MTAIKTHSSTSWKLISAFAAVYLIWGSTYLAIRFAIETIPPLAMLGIRFFLAGLILYAFLLIRGVAAPSAKQWLNGAIVGSLTLSIGTGAVAWAEMTVPSGVAALIVTSVPIWMVLLAWKWRGGKRPNRYVFAGLLLGLVGIVLLVDVSELFGSFSGNSMGILVILLGSLSWSIGSIQARELDMPGNHAMSTAVQMFMGGATLLLGAAVRGEYVGLDVSAISMQSWLAVAYLLVFGSLVAFSSYVWLIHNASAAQVSTYAYVNPVVAVFLGWLFAGEEMGVRMFAAVVVLVSAVVLISRFGEHPPKAGFGRTISGWLGVGVWTRAMDSQKRRLRNHFHRTSEGAAIARPPRVNQTKQTTV